MNIMKNLVCIAFFILTGFYTQANTTIFTNQVDAFLKENVNRGYVKYKAIKEKPAKLNALLTQISSTNLNELSTEEQKSFLINAYNILVIKNVVDVFPIESPLKVKGFFDVKTFIVAGQKVTLNQLEKEMLYKIYPDARLHFALVCAAIGCPKLSNNAYRAEILDKQLDIQSRKTLNNPKFIQVLEDKVVVSEIFKWYEQDFINGDESLIDFVNTYRALPIEADKKVDYYTYNWQINAAKTLKDRDGVKSKLENKKLPKDSKP